MCVHMCVCIQMCVQNCTHVCVCVCVHMCMHVSMCRCDMYDINNKFVPLLTVQYAGYLKLWKLTPNLILTGSEYVDCHKGKIQLDWYTWL